MSRFNYPHEVVAMVAHLLSGVVDDRENFNDWSACAALDAAHYEVSNWLMNEEERMALLDLIEGARRALEVIA